MADLKATFEKAVADSKSLPEKPDNATLLKIYALYKQATTGDVRRQAPRLLRHGRAREVGRVERSQGDQRQGRDAIVRGPDRVAEVARGRRAPGAAQPFAGLFFAAGFVAVAALPAPPFAALAVKAP